MHSRPAQHLLSVRYQTVTVSNFFISLQTITTVKTSENIQLLFLRCTCDLIGVFVISVHDCRNGHLAVDTSCSLQENIYPFRHSPHLPDRSGWVTQLNRFTKQTFRVNCSIDCRRWRGLKGACLVSCLPLPWHLSVGPTCTEVPLNGTEIFFPSHCFSSRGDGRGCVDGIHGGRC